MQGVFHVKQQERRFGSVSRETLFSAETGRGSFLRRNEVLPEIIIFFCGRARECSSGSHTAAYIARRRTRAGRPAPCANLERRSMKALRRDFSMRAELPAYEPLHRFRCPNFSMLAERSRKASWTEVSSSGACGDGFAFSRQDGMVSGALRLEALFALRPEAGGRGRKKKERTRGPLPVRCGVQERNMPSRHGRPDGCSSPCRFCINVR